MGRIEVNKELSKCFIDTIASGYVLTQHDLIEDAQRFGVSNSTFNQLRRFIGNYEHQITPHKGPGSRWLIKNDPDDVPIQLVKAMHLGRIIYYRGDIKIEETDMEQAVARIAARLHNRKTR